MSRPRRALLALVTASAVAGTARAQPAARDEATPPGADGPAPAEPRGAAPAEPTDGGAATPTPAAGDAATAPPVAPASDGEPGAEPASGLEAICDIDPDACPRLDLAAEAAKPLDEVIYSVQPLYALKKRRFQLLPYWSITLNDQFVQHPGPRPLGELLPRRGGRRGGDLQLLPRLQRRQRVQRRRPPLRPGGGAALGVRLGRGASILST
jgi:hypothetical protein